jgi:hypothetical protein
MTTLRTRIAAAITRPMTFAEIEREVGKREPLLIGLELARMAVDGQIKRSEPREFFTLMPVYFVGKLPNGFRHPARPKALAVDSPAPVRQ